MSRKKSIWEMDGQLDMFSMSVEQEQSEEKTITSVPVIVVPEIKPRDLSKEIHSFFESTLSSVSLAKPIKAAKKHDYHITSDDIGFGNVRSKCHTNCEAIRLLNQLKAEGRLATTDEQDILAEYSGWGGIQEAFDNKNPIWKKEYDELSSLLSADDYSSAKASTLTAFYTPPIVIRAIYKALESFGFKGGNVMEPSCGIGNFFGMMPENMRTNSKLYGVEIDSVSGNIAKQLYQKADIKICGFEKTTFPDNFFDVVIGNVPFGDFKVSDSKYDRLNFNIHDYFFAKALDLVRPGGIVAFITSKFTMDKKSMEIRQYIAKRAELIGAIRLPETAFKNAGTTVTADVIFLQKRDSICEISPDWLNIGSTPDGIPVNQYFADNPNMMLGVMKTGTRYGANSETMLVPKVSSNLAIELDCAVTNLSATISAMQHDEETGEEIISIKDTIPASPDVKNFSYTVIDGLIYYRENSVMIKKTFIGKRLERMNGLITLKNAVHEVINTQLNNCSDNAIEAAREELNLVYDSFISSNGCVNSRGNSLVFREDVDYPLLQSLEIFDDEKIKKADIFSKRTINPFVKITHVDTAAEAIPLCLNEYGRVDMNYICMLCGKSLTAVIKELRGIVYQNPEKWSDGDNDAWETASEYLSGNVRNKLKVAEEFMIKYPNRFALNVCDLRKIQPIELDASEISVRIGALWVDPEDYKTFIMELLNPQPKSYYDKYLKVELIQINKQWHITEKYSDNGVKSTEVFGTRRINAYEIIERSLNLKDVKIYDTIDDKRIFNKDETILAQEKQELLQNEFKQWIFKDSVRRNRLVKKYNEIFNSVRLREYDGSHITFHGIANEISLMSHQRDAVARILYNGNTLLAQVVGAGKSATRS